MFPEGTAKDPQRELHRNDRPQDAPRRAVYRDGRLVAGGSFENVLDGLDDDHQGCHSHQACEQDD